MTYAVRRCPTHACKMTLLFQNYVCDECEPPKMPERKNVPYAAIEQALKEIDWHLFGVNHPMKGPGGTIQRINFPEGYLTNLRSADIVLAFRLPVPVPRSPTVYIIKHRWALSGSGPQPINVDVRNMQHLEILGVPVPPGIRAGGHLIGTHYVAVRVA